MYLFHVSKSEAFKFEDYRFLNIKYLCKYNKENIS